MIGCPLPRLPLLAVLDSHVVSARVIQRITISRREGITTAALFVSSASGCDIPGTSLALVPGAVQLSPLFLDHDVDHGCPRGKFIRI